MKKILLFAISLFLMINTSSLLCSAEGVDNKYTIEPSKYETKDYQISSESKVSKFSYGNNSIGEFSISGNIDPQEKNKNFPAYGVNQGNVTFSFICNGSYKYTSEDKWHIVEDDSKKIDGESLDAKIETGAILIQKSEDGKSWKNAVNPLVDFYAKNPKGRSNLYTTDGADIAKGCFYRVIVAYQMERRIAKDDFLYFDKYKNTENIEIYEFYLCSNAGNISIHNMAQEPCDISLACTRYENGKKYDLSDKNKISKNFKYGSSSAGTLIMRGQFANNSGASYNIVKGPVSFSYHYDGRLNKENLDKWKIIEDDKKSIGDISLDQEIQKGVFLFQHRKKGEEWENVIDPIYNFFSRYPKGIDNFYKLSDFGTSTQYYRIIVAYYTSIRTDDGVIWDSYDELRDVEVYNFSLTYKNTEMMSYVDNEMEGFTIESLERGESLLDDSVASVGFIIDKLGTTNKVLVNGTEAADGQEYTSNGKYEIEITTSFGKKNTKTVYIYNGDGNQGKNRFFDNEYVKGKRTFRDGEYPSYGCGALFKINEHQEEIPGLHGTITNITTGEIHEVTEDTMNEQIIELTTGEYVVELYCGNLDAGNIYSYQFHFNILEEEALPYVNYNALMTSDALSNLESKHYEVVYQTTAGGYIYVCFGTYEDAFLYAYEIEKRFIEKSEGSTYYKSLENPNVKIRYENNDAYDKIALTSALNYYADQNVEVAYFNPLSEFTYKTFDSEEELMENLESLSVTSSIKVFPSVEEKERLINRKPFLNDFTFMHVADYDVVSVEAKDLKNDTQYQISFGKPVDKQLTATSMYSIVETNEYGDQRTYDACYMNKNMTESVWKAIQNGNEKVYTLNADSISDNNEVTADILYLDSISNEYDEWAIVSIKAPKVYSFDLAGLTSEMSGLTLYKAGDYEITFTDRIGNNYQWLVHITGASSMTEVKYPDKLSYTELYNKLYLNDKAMNEEVE